ncbi:MAG: undecaprenyl-diphosphate phosphatase [Oscillospiraceae bacterium]|jgi:undecaprenyl-diphosphatase|nr:undecaprenyl-diphosphate phosphatase [Oscillospiraceae bacterium]
MTSLEAAVQGIIQGVTEFLPISSSGHLAIAQHFFGIKENNMAFNVALHVGTLFSVVAVYHELIFKLIVSFFTSLWKFFSGKKRNDSEQIFVNLLVSVIPLFLIFLPFPKFNNIKSIADSFANNPNMKFVGFAMIFTGILLFISVFASKKANRQIGKMSAGDSFCIGIAQFVAAIFPGLSRSGSTFSIGVLRGVEKQSALDFSFIMGIPAIAAAAVLELREVYSAKIVIEAAPIIVGMLASMVVGFFSIKALSWIIKTNGMWVFSVYALFLGTILVFFV